MEEKKSFRCKVCIYYVTRIGCINNDAIPERYKKFAYAFMPPKNEIYKKTTCPYFKQEEGLK